MIDRYVGKADVCEDCVKYWIFGEDECDYCGGSGYEPSGEDCFECNGAGYIKEKPGYLEAREEAAS